MEQILLEAALRHKRNEEVGEGGAMESSAWACAKASDPVLGDPSLCRVMDLVEVPLGGQGIVLNSFPVRVGRP